MLAHPRLQPHLWGAKGVGSQGDGTAQFLCKGRAGQEAVVAALEADFGLHTIRLHIPCSTSGDTSDPPPPKRRRPEIPRIDSCTGSATGGGGGGAGQGGSDGEGAPAMARGLSSSLSSAVVNAAASASSA